MSERVLVTGGAGFIGSHLVDSLLEDGYEVCAVDNFDPFYEEAVKRRHIEVHLQSRSFRLEECDIRDAEGIVRIFELFRPSIVVHLAAKAGVRPSLQTPDEYVEVNVSGTANVLNAAVRTGVRRVVFGSSSSVYGLNPQVPFAEEASTLRPASPYAATKIAGEALCHSYSNCFGLPIVALRFFTVYGPRQRPDLAIHKFAQKILTGQPIPVFGDGTTSRDYTYISDIIQGVRAAMDVSTSGYEVFNLGNDQPTRLLDLIHFLEESLGKKAIMEWLPMQVGDVPITWADISKSKEKLGYRPKMSMQEGLERFVNWMKESNRSGV
jgi:UDP-glucuronate 4-epimerase